MQQQEADICCCSYLCAVWQIGHGGQEGVLGVEHTSLAHVPDLEACDQAWYQHTGLTPQVYYVPGTCRQVYMSQLELWYSCCRLFIVWC